MHPRVLIIATTPYSENYSSRTLDAYFHNWEKENVAQIFTRNIIPTKGHCGELYQITDAKLLDRWLNKTKKTGKIYHYEDLNDSGSNQVINNNSMQKIGTKHTPTIEILRRILWKKKYWCTSELNEWLDNFQPECVFYNFSNHIFTQQIALYVADRYNIPIITAIGDDFYFNDQKSFSPAYHLYRKKFKKLSELILKRNNSRAVYCNDKIKAKYNNEFNLNGETIYFSSAINRKAFKPINSENPLVCYFGNIRLGRNKSLLDVATALGNINPNYKLEIYSGEKDPAYYRELVKHLNVFYGGQIPYSQVMERTKESDIIVVVEGFAEADLAYARYSLSTKASDALACGSSIFVYGPQEAGLIDYLISSDSVAYCTSRNDLEKALKHLIQNADYQKSNYDHAINAFDKNHTIERNCLVFENLVIRLLEEYRVGVGEK